MKRFLCFFIFSVFLLCSAQQTTAVKDVDTTKEKFVIGCHGAGFFSIFFGALNNITWCEQNNKIPVIYWNKKCHYYQPEGYNGTYNAWKYYFEPVSELSYEQGDKIFKSYFTPSIRPLIGINPRNPSKKKRTFIKEHLIDRYIKIKPSIAQKIEDFYLQNMAGKKTIGIHLRGTDKWKETRPVDPEIILAEANKYADLGYQFLVASDENKLLEMAKSTLRSKAIFYDAKRSDDDKPVYRYSNAKMGEEVLIEAQLLARCDKFIHTKSNVSTAVLFFNPNLENTLLEANA